MGPGSPEPRTRASSGRDDNGVREATRCKYSLPPRRETEVGLATALAAGSKNESRKRPTNKRGLTHRFFVLRDWLRVLLLSVIPCAMRHPYAASQTRDLGSSKCALNKIPDQRRINIGLLRRIRDPGCEVPARVSVLGCGRVSALSGRLEERESEAPNRKRGLTQSTILRFAGAGEAGF